MSFGSDGWERPRELPKAEPYGSLPTGSDEVLGTGLQLTLKVKRAKRVGNPTGAVPLSRLRSISKCCTVGFD